MKKYLTLLYFIIAAHYLNADQFHVCTVASREGENLHKLVQSCKQHHIDLDVVGMGRPYWKNGTKLVRLKEYLRDLPDDDIVMFVDAFDVLIVADKEIILEKFLHMNSPFIMSAEKNCFPFEWLAPEFPASPTAFKYPNSGSFIGYVRVLKEWLEALAPINKNASDQGQIGKQFIKGPQFFTFDYTCELFLPLFMVEDSEVVIDLESGVVRCLPTNSTPYVIHANGKSFSFYDSVYSQLVHEQAKA
jgi:hypothetical protein